MSMKNSSDTIANRTRDLPACSAVPPPFLSKAYTVYFTLFITRTDSNRFVIHEQQMHNVVFTHFSHYDIFGELL